MNQPILFEPCRVMGLTLSNRFIRSATLEGLASPEGAPPPELKALYLDLAYGGVGLISTSACLPDQGWAPRSVRLLSLHQEQPLPVWKDLVRTVHRAGSLTSVQLAPVFLLEGKRGDHGSLSQFLSPLFNRREDD